MGEIKQANFRIDSDTADAFRAFCEQKGMNQAQGFDHVMQVFELNQAKSSIPGRSVEIEEFETMVKSITSAYLYSLELNQKPEHGRSSLLNFREKNCASQSYRKK